MSIYRKFRWWPSTAVDKCPKWQCSEGVFSEIQTEYYSLINTSKFDNLKNFASKLCSFSAPTFLWTLTNQSQQRDLNMQSVLHPLNPDYKKTKRFLSSSDFKNI